MAAHRYWRLYVIETADQATYTSVAELEFYATRESTTDLTGSGTAIASSFLDAARAPAKAFANDLGTSYWASSDGTKPQWIGYDFGAGNDVEVNALKMWPRSDNLDAGGRQQTPKTFWVQYSDDGVAWENWWFECDWLWPVAANGAPRAFYKPDAPSTAVTSSVAVDESAVALLLGGGGQVVGAAGTALLLGGGGQVISKASVALLLGVAVNGVTQSAVSVVFGGNHCQVKQAAVSVVYTDMVSAVKISLKSESDQFNVLLDDAPQTYRIRVQ